MPRGPSKGNLNKVPPSCELTLTKAATWSHNCVPRSADYVRALRVPCSAMRTQFRPQLVHRVARRTLIVRSMSDSIQKAETRTPSLARIKRQYVKLENGQPGSNGTVLPTVKVLQWNLLADGLAQNGDFIKVRPEVLEWSYRKPLILAELLEAHADVIALQELNYFEEIQDSLRPLGYEGLFLAKLHSPAIKYSSPADGVALFWRTDRFQACERHSFHYRDSSGAPQPQACLSVLLAEQSGKQLLVTTTHLKAKEGADLDVVRLQQMQQLLEGIDVILNKAGTTTSPSSPSTNGTQTQAPPPPHTPIRVVITGDFNTTAKSKPCQLLATKSFRSIWDVPVQGGTSHDDADTSSSSTTTAVQGQGSSSTNGTSEGQQQREGSSTTNGTGGGSASTSCEFSTWKFRSGGESKRIIDHMWFTGLLPRSRWRMLTEDEIGCAGLPCEGYPSDHVALCCEFNFE